MNMMANRQEDRLLRLSIRTMKQETILNHPNPTNVRDLIPTADF